MITRPLLCALLQPQLLPTLPSRSALHPPLPPTPALRSRAPLLAAADDEGKFVRHSELNPGCAPLGVLLAGFGEDELEAIAMSIEEVFSGPDGAITHVPIVPLAAGDTRVRLRDVLATLAERDSVLPDSPLRLQAPLVMLSGFNTVQTSAAVRAVGALGLVRPSHDSLGYASLTVDCESQGVGTTMMYSNLLPRALCDAQALPLRELDVFESALQVDLAAHPDL